MEDQSILEWLGISGILAILGAAIGYGQLHGRVKTLEDRADADQSQENAIAIARLEERTKAMQQDIQTIKEAVTRKH